MPVKKPLILNVKNDTKTDRADRANAESMMTPSTELALKPPMSLNGHKPAAEIWKRVIGLYREVDGIIATAFDEGLLVNYCILKEECLWLEKKRGEVDAKSTVLDKQINAFTKKKLTDDDYKTLYKLYKQYNVLNTRVQGLDARLDGKRKLVFSIEQSLYLTPRSRAGVAPPVKEAPEPEDPTEKLLNE